jgi:hypothetical protein
MSRQHTSLRNLMFLLVIIVIGCSSYPQARYYKAPPNPDKDKKVLIPFAPDKKNLIPFSLQGALVTIAPKPALVTTKEEKTNQPKAQLDALGLTGDPKLVASIEDLKNVSQAFATQADAADSIYFLEPKDDVLTKSNISVTYYDGQHRIKAIGTEFQDDRIKVIQALGGAVAAVVPILLAPPTKAPPAPLGENLQLPLVFDFTYPIMFTSIIRDKDGPWVKIAGYTTWWYKYKISHAQGRIFATEKFFESRNDFTREFPVSACVDLTLQIAKADKNPDEIKDYAGHYQYTLRIPDPTIVEPLPFPLKGSITSHTVCGADISTQPSNSANTFEILEAVAKQVKAIWETQKK